MAKIVILGGGFGGVMTAESLAQRLGVNHQITLVSRGPNFVFYPALVRLAFGKATIEDVSFDLRQSMINRSIRFIEGEVARVDPRSRRIVLAHGDVQGEIIYDYLVLALGRRLATERIKGFFEYAHHTLSVNAALKFGRAVQDFSQGRAVIGSC